MRRITPDDIDAVLPQTQCGLCGHGGCMPYAESLIYEGEAINLCPPGGVPVLRQLGDLLGKDPTPFEEEMRAKAKPPLLALIREDECIGCTKCIQACPVDAILGSAKSMHSVISKECTGCELCVPACPVDCIDLIPDPDSTKEANHFRTRFLAREQRLAQENLTKLLNKQQQSRDERASYIQAAQQRVRDKKSFKS